MSGFTSRASAASRSSGIITARRGARFGGRAAAASGPSSRQGTTSSGEATHHHHASHHASTHHHHHHGANGEANGAGRAPRPNSNGASSNGSTTTMKAYAEPVPSNVKFGGDKGWFETYTKVANIFQNLFPLWTVLAAASGLARPALFSWIKTSSFTAGLGLLMFSMGITLTLKDFQRVLTKPGPVSINFLCCYVLMPLLGLAVGRAFALSPPIVAGLVLVGSINGGQASNLCTYIARGDVALSVVMTTSTTLGCIFMTPLIAKMLLGTIVPVDAVGVAISAMQVSTRSRANHLPSSCLRLFPRFCG